MCLAQNQGRTPEQHRFWRSSVYAEIRARQQGKLNVERMCQIARVSRSGYYRQWAVQEPAAEEMEVRAAIQEVVLTHRRRYGYRRVSAELRRRGLVVNHKRVSRLMREDNLLAIQRRKFVITTDSRHDLEVYLNLAVRMQLTAVNQLWVADITYIRLQKEFVYLAVVIDRFSRCVAGWSLDRTLAARLPLSALQKAVIQRQPAPGLVHHSDRGFQYASHDYVRLLQDHKMIPSMSRPANPYDNAACESFMKTLKQEEIHCHEYSDLEDLTAHLEQFIDRYYNQQRLHSALGYRPPVEFEEHHAACADEGITTAAKMSFFRHEEIFQSDVPKSDAGEQECSRSPAHRLDESPAGYSLASCSPAELASASPAEADCVVEGKKS